MRFFCPDRRIFSIGYWAIGLEAKLFLDKHSIGFLWDGLDRGLFVALGLLGGALVGLVREMLFGGDEILFGDVDVLCLFCVSNVFNL